MNETGDPRRNGSLLAEAGAEIRAMARDGLEHPSSRPVLVGAGIGALAGAVLPVVSWPLGLLIGAGFVLYKRLRP